MKRVTSLDVLRGIAIILVLGRHIPTPVPKLWPYVLLRPTQNGGWIGVDLFFVLSGYLVSGLLFDEYRSRGRVDPARFLIRRGFRIYPAYYALLAFSVWVSFDWVRLGNIFVEAFFVQAYFYSWAMWNHTWSLAIEEHFYFLLALLLWLLSRQGGKDPFKLLPWLMVLLGVYCFSMRTLIYPPFSVNVFMTTHTRVDSLFFGVLIAYLVRYHEWFRPWARRHRWALLAFGALATLPAFYFEIHYAWGLSVWGLTLLYLGFGGWVAAAPEFGPAPAFLRPFVAALTWIGERSYSIYLWHMTANKIFVPTLNNFLDDPSVWRNVWTFVLISLGLGIVSHRWIEKPFLRLRDKLYPSPVS